MGSKKRASLGFIFKRLNAKSSSEDDVVIGRDGGRRRWKSRTSTGFRRKRRFSLRHWLIDTVLFKIVSVLEAIVLLSKLCFFFFLCGCKF